MKRELTPEQKTKSDERKAKFRALWKQVAAMPELERIQLSNKLGFVNVEGHAFSLANTMLLALQCPGGSVFGGFRQWIKQGRAVRKGQHGQMIWIPIGGSKGNITDSPLPQDGANAEAFERRFITGTVFDISQTDEMQADNPIAVVSPEIAQAFGMIHLPNVRVPVQDEMVIA